MGFAERGLGSLPGGDESVLVRGVRACMEVGWPVYDILQSAVENTDEAVLATELSEPTSFKSSRERLSSSPGDSVFFGSRGEKYVLGADDCCAVNDCTDGWTDKSTRGDSVRLDAFPSLSRVS